MKIIGLVGGVASGKSAVAATFAELGAAVLDADRLAHATLAVPEVRDILVSRWGNAVLDSHGEVSRPAVANRVFGDTAAAAVERDFLEKALHPRIRQRVEADLDRLAKSDTKAAVIDAPLLLEAGWGELCDEVIFVDTPRKTRESRAKRRNWTLQEFTRREGAQMPITEKRAAASHVVSNDGTLKELNAEVSRLWHELLGSA
ncbi:dephospho-CoA kinase [Adhaeretor mobilis]|nr:dephospho-CoA kinase [Adhaeretor mobilis]